MRKASAPIAVQLFVMALVSLPPAAFCNTTYTPDGHSALKKQDGQGHLAAQVSVTKIPAGGIAAWKEEFERICAQTETATSLSAEQLRKLIADSDVLLEQLYGVEDPWAKVYIVRLKNCQSFFAFTLEWQEQQQQGLEP